MERIKDLRLQLMCFVKDPKSMRPEKKDLKACSLKDEIERQAA